MVIIILEKQATPCQRGMETQLSLRPSSSSPGVTLTWLPFTWLTISPGITILAFPPLSPLICVYNHSHVVQNPFSSMFILSLSTTRVISLHQSFSPPQLFPNIVSTRVILQVSSGTLLFSPATHRCRLPSLAFDPHHTPTFINLTCPEPQSDMSLFGVLPSYSPDV